jgi:mRNA interferase MazF
MANPRTLTYPKRGQVYLVNFDPTLGAEIKKTRPALILQNDVANHYSPITIVAAISSRFQEPLYPTEVFLAAGDGGLTLDSVVLLNQIRSVDKQRLVKPLGALKPGLMVKVDQALSISLGLLPID